jgi:hypothetical protein
MSLTRAGSLDREKVADVHCGIGSWRGDRRRRVLVLAIL